MRFTIFVLLFCSLNSIGQVPQQRYDSLLLICNTQKKTIDSLKPKLLVANYTLSRIRYHVDIVGRRPSQLKYLRGWVLRDLRGAGK